jgi:hypothetical protein
MDRKERDSELVALSTATVIVYRQVMGLPLEPSDVNEMNEVMHEVAHAISYAASIYAAKSEGDEQQPLPATVLTGAAFERGATILRTPEGLTYQKLAIRRDDMLLAANVITRTGVRFAARGKRRA